MKVGIVTVPYITTDSLRDYASGSLASLQSEEHELYHIAVVNAWRDSDARALEHYYDKIILNDQNILARAWNIGIEHALQEGCDYVICPNLDIIAHPQCIDNLVACAEENPDGVIWCATQCDDKEGLLTKVPHKSVSTTLQRYSFSFYMVNDRLFKEVKKFNEIFKPCYFEDWEMILYCHYRKKPIYRTNHALFFHYVSRTKHASTENTETVNEFFTRNEKIYNKIEQMITAKI